MACTVYAPTVLSERQSVEGRDAVDRVDADRTLEPGVGLGCS